jgi:hypothetical protein
MTTDTAIISNALSVDFTESDLDAWLAVMRYADRHAGDRNAESDPLAGLDRPLTAAHFEELRRVVDAAAAITEQRSLPL